MLRRVPETKTAAMMASIRKNAVVCVLFLTLYVFVQAKACISDSECRHGYAQYCCERRYPEDNVCRSNCIGESCIFDTDCATEESCCGGSNKCNTSCVGKSCSYDGDCATEETCCGYKCKSGSCSLAGWIVAVIVISVLVVIVLPIGVVVFCCFCAAGAASSWRRPGQVIITQPATTGTTALATQQQQLLYPSAQQGQPMYFQNAQPCPNEPPPYQPQGAVYPPEASAQSMAMTPQTGVKQ